MDVLARRFLVFLVFLASGTLHAQNAQIDRLELLFAQGHYKRVYRKANALLDNPEFDLSLMPEYYKSISILQLAQNKQWRLNREGILQESARLFNEVRKSPDGALVLDAHRYELAGLKKDLISWAEDLKRIGDEKTFKEVQGILTQFFQDIELDDLIDPVFKPDEGESVNITDHHELRKQIVLDAERNMGVPYVWAGSSPEGFDCSGFTGYVMGLHGKNIARRAADQYEESRKLKEKDVQAGDLIFFDNGSGISHVGIVTSGKGQPLVMIHASSSKGIVVTDVSNSDYWKKRIYGFGTYIN